MKNRRTIYRILKWIGAVICILILASWIISGWWEIAAGWGHNAGGQFTLIPGTLILTIWFSDDMPLFTSGWRFEPTSLTSGMLWGRWSWETMSWSSQLNNHSIRQIIVPLWFLSLLSALPTVFLWWRDHRRIPPGHCRKCGYDLTGNVSGRCPECGTPAPVS